MRCQAACGFCDADYHTAGPRLGSRQSRPSEDLPVHQITPVVRQWAAARGAVKARSLTTSSHPPSPEDLADHSAAVQARHRMMQRTTEPSTTSRCQPAPAFICACRIVPHIDNAGIRAVVTASVRAVPTLANAYK